MYQSPRTRRLRSDLSALERLRSESSVFQFAAKGDPVEQYLVTFRGKSLWLDQGQIKTLELHRVEIKLGSSYPRTIPELRWVTPIHHPNISEIGMICMGGYGTNWAPSVQLDELCTMLWDMARYHNYDIRSPYNREAALWAARQSTFRFPLDTRPLRDLRVALGRIDHVTAAGPRASHDGSPLAIEESPWTQAASRARELLRGIGRGTRGRQLPDSPALAEYALAEQACDPPILELTADDEPRSPTASARSSDSEIVFLE